MSNSADSTEQAAQLAVLGSPIAQSRSPQLHQLFAAQCGLPLHYGKVEPASDGFGEAISQLRQQGYLGCNVTMPFKDQAFALADTLSERARLAEAVNTLSFNGDGSLSGDNTDGVGLLRDLMVNQQQVIRGKRVLVLGAGGAVQGFLGMLLEEKPAELIIANRTLPRAQQLVDKFSVLAGDTRLSVCQLDQLPQEPCDLVLNATAIGIQGEPFELSTACLGPDTFAYDLIYKAEPTAFMQWARPHVAATCDGLGMLVEQGAESFYLWFGHRPDTRPVLDTLRQQLLLS